MVILVTVVTMIPLTMRMINDEEEDEDSKYVVLVTRTMMILLQNILESIRYNTVRWGNQQWWRRLSFSLPSQQQCGAIFRTTMRPTVVNQIFYLQNNSSAKGVMQLYLRHTFQ